MLVMGHGVEEIVEPGGEGLHRGQAVLYLAFWMRDGRTGRKRFVQPDIDISLQRDEHLGRVLDRWRRLEVPMREPFTCFVFCPGWGNDTCETLPVFRGLSEVLLSWAGALPVLSYLAVCRGRLTKTVLDVRSLSDERVEGRWEEANGSADLLTAYIEHRLDGIEVGGRPCFVVFVD